MESPPIPSGILHNHSHYHILYSPLNHLLLTGLFSLRACTTRRLGATSGLSPLRPACLASPLPLLLCYYFLPDTHPFLTPFVYRTTHFSTLDTFLRVPSSENRLRVVCSRSPPLADALHDQAHAHLPRSRSPRSRSRPLHRYKPACLPASAAPRFSRHRTPCSLYYLPAAAYTKSPSAIQRAPPPHHPPLYAPRIPRLRAPPGGTHADHKI